MLVLEEVVKKYNLKLLVEIVVIGIGGVDFLVMGMGLVFVIRKVFNKIDLKLKDMELIELNEVFVV